MEEATYACLKDDWCCMVDEATDSTGYACKTEEGFVSDSVSVSRGGLKEGGESYFYMIAEFRNAAQSRCRHYK